MYPIWRRLFPIISGCVVFGVGAGMHGQETSPVSDAFAVEMKEDRLDITAVKRGPVATYVFRDDKILRPYFTHLHSSDGVLVTRKHPPIAGQDAVDHDTMHPGLWMAFGDMNGNDFWRNKATIKHEKFREEPEIRGDRVTFAAVNSLQSPDGQSLGSQISRITLARRSTGYLIVWDAAFTPSGEEDLVFGDQEEMGVGVRVATAITEKSGGVVRNSSGAVGAKLTWGKTADWTDYSGIIGERQIGILLMPDPKNFRPSWFHNRDYGLMVANPFGQRAFTKGEKSAVVVKKGEILRLRFGVLLHTAPASEPPDLAAEYVRFTRELDAAEGEAR